MNANEFSRYAVLLLAPAAVVSAIVLALAQRGIAAELERRGLCRGIEPALTRTWRALAGALIACGGLWSLSVAGVIDLATFQPHALPASLIGAGLVVLYIYRGKGKGGATSRKAASSS